MRKTRAGFASPPSVHLALLAWIYAACVELRGISGNTVDFSCEAGEPPRVASFLQDALRVSADALCSGREGQDLGLPLLHVLGKRLEKGMRAGLRRQSFCKQQKRCDIWQRCFQKLKFYLSFSFKHAL